MKKRIGLIALLLCMISQYRLAQAYDVLQGQGTTSLVTRMQAQRVVLRKFPWPYQAMLAIDSDADHTDLRKFNEVHEFLNTFDETPMGKGLGLDVSDSFFLYNGSNLSLPIDVGGKTVKNEMTMFQGTSKQLSVYAPILLHYIRHGWIDTYHSAGDFSRWNTHTTLFRRSLEVQAMYFLKEQHIPAILDFTDHGNQSNVANFGSYDHFDRYMQGDNPSSPYYIADLVQQEGVKFLWADNYDNQYVYSSMLYPIRLRNGTKIWGFHRFTGTRTFWHKKREKEVVWREEWTPYKLAVELSDSRLQQLIQAQGYTIVATHLEGNADKMPLPTTAIEALTHLAHLQDEGKILVARTSRLLWYNLVQQGLTYRVLSGTHHPITYIDVTGVNDPVDGNFVPTWQELRGITWFVPHPNHATIIINGQLIPNNAIVRTKGTIGIAWYPSSTINWAVSLHTPEYQQLKQQMLQNEKNQPRSL